MKAKGIKIGNSKGIMLSKQLSNQYDLEAEVEVIPKKEGILLKKAVRTNPCDGWEA